MALLYVDEVKSSLNRADVAAGETIQEGEFVVQNGDGALEQFDPSADTLPHGIVVHNPQGDSIVEHDEDYVAYSDLWTYNGNEGDRAYYQPLAGVDQIIPRTLADNGTDPEPSVGEGTVVGIVTINGTTEIVEEGYTDNGGTKYGDGGTGDFVALGRIDKEPTELKLGDAYGLRVPVRLDEDIFTA
jgi:hypothetical protein